MPCNDEMAFARATARLMDDAELRMKLGSYGRKRVEEELQWSVVSRNLLKAYDSLCLPNAARQNEPAGCAAVVHGQPSRGE